MWKYLMVVTASMVLGAVVYKYQDLIFQTLEENLPNNNAKISSMLSGEDTATSLEEWQKNYSNVQKSARTMPKQKLPTLKQKSPALPRSMERSYKKSNSSIKNTKNPASVTVRQQTEKSKGLLASRSPLDREAGNNNRWISNLSGRKTKMDFVRKGSCPVGDTECSNPQEAPKDISLVGVVVETSKVSDNESPIMDGTIHQGNFIENTPAVYLK